jgi:hypothetical protein
MNTISLENQINLATAENYYSSMLAKDFDKMANYLHANVHFISPFGEMNGRDAVVAAASKDLGSILQDIQIRSKFAKDNQIMIAYDFIFSEPKSLLRAALLMEFTENKISKSELFFDGRSFD